jgi:hypothetical protein
MRSIFAAAAVAVLLASSASAAPGELKLTIQDGRVTLVAEAVPLRQILAEWARVGQTKIVNAEKVAGAPVTLTLTNVPEREALQTLLRSVSGFMVAPREVPVANASQFDRILIMAAALPPPTFTRAASAPPPAPTQPTMPLVQPPPADDQVTEQDEQARPAPSAPAVNTATAGMPAAAGRPPETTFDYANPQQLRAIQQSQPPPQGPPTTFPGTVVPQQPTPAATPGPSPIPGVTVPTAPRPGIIPNPTNTPARNPYGIPTNVQPGSQVPPPTEPDRSKYANPPGA